MDFDSLSSAQEEMRERWSYRRRSPITRRIVSSEIAEAIEAKQMAERTDLVCAFCKANPTEANKRSGEIMPCKSCKQKDYNLRRKYPGMSLRRYYNMMHDQHGKCAICTCEKWADLVVDRCQVVGHVRGLLCPSCNSIIALAGEREGVFRNAVNYLKSNLLRSGWRATFVEDK